MKKILPVIIGITLIFMLEACGLTTESNVSQASSKQDNPSADNETTASNEQQSSDFSNTSDIDKTLVVYFSCTGKTETVAGYITKAMSADIYEIVPEEAYSADDIDYTNLKSRAILEQNDDSARPKISGSVENMKEYNVVFLGYPIWCGKAPRIISTFLESYDFSGKTIIPFCTSGSSGINDSVTDLQSLCSETATWISGERFSGSTDDIEVKKWVDSLKLR